MRSVVTAFRLLETVSEHQPIGVSDLARAVGVPKSTVQRGLGVLHDLGWIRPDGGEPTRWALTTKALSVGGRVATTDLRTLVRPVMRRLRDRSGENVHLAVADGPSSTLLDKFDSPHAVRTFHQVGATGPIYATSTGKAMLAHRPAEDVEAIIAAGLVRYTPTTITDPERLRTELALVRERGWSVNHGEWREDVTAVAAPLRDQVGFAVAAISISSPAHRLTADMVPELGRVVADACAELTVPS